MISYEIKTMELYDEKIGELVFMLNHVRAVTINEVEKLSLNQLDTRIDKNGNTIGSLLLHIASIEKVHQIISFEGRDINSKEYKEWGQALEFSDKERNQTKGEPIEYYLERLSAIRQETFKRLKEKQDDWLYLRKEWPNGVAYNQFYLWFHVLEDEINHRGQIRTMKRILQHNVN